MKGRILDSLILASIIICLVINVGIFYNMGVFVYENVTSFSVIAGSDFWVYMDWVRLGLILTLLIIHPSNMLFTKLSISSISLIISAKLLWSMFIYADKFNKPLGVICGSDFWFYMNLIRVGLLLIICVLLIIKILDKKDLKRNIALA